MPFDIDHWLKTRTTEDLVQLRKSLLGDWLWKIDDELKKRGEAAA